MVRLGDSRPKQLYTECPVMHMDPVDNRLPSTGGVYRTPVYKELSRKGTLSTSGHFVMWIELPSDREDFIYEGGFSDPRPCG
jgi:dynein heavy chain